MIIQEQGDHLVLIRQTDHTVLAGHFARELGNDTFALPQPQESFALAATEHDNGWNEWELLPEIDSVTYLPYSFMSIPTREHIALYQRGIERVVKADHYAGLLVSMHCLGLYDRTRATMPGFSAKYVKSHESQTVNDFLQSLRLQQLRLKVDLRADPKTKDFAEEKWCRRIHRGWKRWTGFRSISAWDRWRPRRSKQCRPIITATKWTGICSPKETMRWRSSHIRSGAIRWRSAFWRAASRGGATPTKGTFRNCWARHRILL